MRPAGPPGAVRPRTSGERWYRVCPGVWTSHRDIVRTTVRASMACSGTVAVTAMDSTEQASRGGPLLWFESRIGCGLADCRAMVIDARQQRRRECTAQCSLVAVCLRTLGNQLRTDEVLLVKAEFEVCLQARKMVVVAWLLHGPIPKRARAAGIPEVSG